MDGVVIMETVQTIKTKKGEIKLPCMTPIIVPIDKVQANNYNPKFKYNTC